MTRVASFAQFRPSVPETSHFIREWKSFSSRLTKGILRDQFEALLKNQDETAFYQDLLVFASGLRGEADADIAPDLFSILGSHPDVPREIRSEAEKRLAARRSSGSSEYRLEYLLGRLVQEATNGTVIASASAATMLGGLSQAYCLERLFGRSASLLTRGLGAQITARVFALGWEGLAFATLARMDSPKSARPFGHDLASAYLNIGLMNLTGAGFGNILGPKSSEAISLSAQFAGLIAAQRIEFALGLRPGGNANAGFFDDLAAVVGLCVGSHLGQRFLGPRFSKLTVEMEMHGDGILQSTLQFQARSPLLLSNVGKALPNTKWVSDRGISLMSGEDLGTKPSALARNTGNLTVAKRFRVSEDSFSSARLQFILDFRKAWGSAIGIPVAFSLFGSLSKGKRLDRETALSTDIDAAVFLDLDHLKTRFPKLVTEAKYRKFREIYTEMTGTVEYDEIFALAALESYFFKILHRFSLNPGISGEISRMEQMGFGKSPEWGEWFQLHPIRLQGDFSLQALAKSIIDFETEGAREHPTLGELMERSLMAEEIAQMELQLTKAFFLDVGGGLRAYRKAFFEDLSRIKGKKKRERIWSIIRDSLVDFERNRKYGNHLPTAEAPKLYPVDFAEAQRRFGGLKSKAAR